MSLRSTPEYKAIADAVKAGNGTLNDLPSWRTTFDAYGKKLSEEHFLIILAEFQDRAAYDRFMAALQRSPTGKKLEIDAKSGPDGSVSISTSIGL